MESQDYTKREIRQKFYNSSEWHMLRNYLLAREPLCDMCIERERITPATTCHHIIDIVDAPDRRFDTKNIQTLCESCHNSITAINTSGSEKNFKPVEKKWSTEVLKIKKPK